MYKLNLKFTTTTILIVKVCIIMMHVTGHFLVYINKLEYTSEAHYNML